MLTYSVQVCSYMHQQYPDFGEELVAALVEAFHVPSGGVPRACHLVLCSSIPWYNTQAGAHAKR